MNPPDLSSRVSAIPYYQNHYLSLIVYNYQLVLDGQMTLPNYSCTTEEKTPGEEESST